MGVKVKEVEDRDDGEVGKMGQNVSHNFLI